ncbi:hypothetical protein PybrP1_012659 [[Pythium] brassicae (nom. inval.)]|nr:hypothetical protein PybrP1_012659 [[Pythium] brassicae (nom. inval.)]
MSPKKLAVALIAFVVCLLGAASNAQTLVSPSDGTGIHVYYRTGWAAPYIHYSVSGTWTTSPGAKMVASTSTQFPAALGWFRYDIAAPATTLEFVFNNGAGTWDNNASKNYKVASAGTWSLTSTVSTPPTAAPSPTPSPAPVAVGATLVKADDGTGLHVYFRSGWAAPYIHYNQGSGWTTSPGVKMTASTDSAFPAGLGWFKIDFAAPAAYLEFVFSNGAGTWDNNGNVNYKLNAAGTWSVVSTVSPPPTTTPPPTAAPSPTPATPTPSPTTRAPATPAPTGPCSNYNGLDSCTSGTQTTYPDSDESRRWQTPSRNASEWKQGFQDYRSLTGYAYVTYDSATRTSATVEVRTNLRVGAAGASCSYSFNGATSSSATFKATSALTTDLNIVATCTASSSGEQWTLTLDPVNFVWQSASVTQPAGMEGGQKGAIVDLFGWPYADIEAECKDFLGKAGYMGVKINPPQESVLSDAWPQSGQRNPWYFIYQPVSFRLHSRMGSRAQLRSMIQTCRANGVRVYADAVVNHMSGGGNDVSSHRNPSGGSCTYWGAKSSAAGSPYYTHNYQYELNKYTGARPALEFPAVPFGPTDFHCDRTLGSWNDALQLETGWLVGLTDLNTAKPYVRERIAQYFVDLMGIGFSGFRVDAVKHIGPTDFAAIMGIFAKFMGGSLPADFISWGEVIMGGEAQLLACNENSGYNFYKGLDAKYAAAGISATDIAKLKIWSSDYPKEMPICGSWILPASRFVVQNDDHDQQNPDSTSRDMGDKGSILIKAKDVNAHRGFETQLFTRTDADWKIKVVLSSYTWFTNGAAGFPDGLSDCVKGFDSSSGQVCDKSVPFEKAFRAGSCGYTVEGFAGGKYTRVHRDLAIVNAMRGWVGLGSVSASQVGISGSC